MTTVSVTGAGSPITVPGLPAGNWSFTARAVTAAGSGAPSAGSAPVVVAVAGGPADFSTPAPVGPPAPVGSWHLQFGDDFLGSALDPTAWVSNRDTQQDRAIGFTNSGALAEAEYFDSAQVSVAGSELVLTAVPGPATVGGIDYTWRSGCVTSRRSGPADLYPVNTYIEARLSVPRGNGLWPAFWSCSHGGDYTAPGYTYTEQDYLEFFDTSLAGQRRPSATYHHDGIATASAEFGVPGTDYTGGYHTYGCLTTATGAVPYLDGVAYPTPALAGTAMNDLSREILFDLAVLRSDPGPPPGSQLRVDWFRLWTAS